MIPAIPLGRGDSCSLPAERGATPVAARPLPLPRHDHDGRAGNSLDQTS
jgi:hypothetical protein